MITEFMIITASLFVHFDAVSLPKQTEFDLLTDMMKK